MQKVNKDLQEYYDLRADWGRLTQAMKRPSQEMINRLEELKKIIGKA